MEKLLGEALLTILCLWNLHFACGTFIKRQSKLEGLSSDGTVVNRYC
ncbi:MAG: hypothetical protein KME21_16950 [Desmonostoc vinosum HA7617-LM4]|nr:hypothetical protein [Desmonostoc vinosum HA7617-LM4]